MTKQCNSCGEIKDVSEFYKDSSRADGYRFNCKSCRAKKIPAKKELSLANRHRGGFYTGRANDREGWTAHDRRLYTYNLTPSDYDQIFEEQNGLCAICLKDLGENFCIDHCHTNKSVRGFLCYGCNTGIGLLQDSPELLTNAIAYLQKTHYSNLARY